MRRRTTAMLGAVGLGFILGSSVLFARQGTVHTKDGTSYAGDVVETDKGTVAITNAQRITTEVNVKNVDRIDYQANPEEELAKRMEALGPKDVAGRIALARAAFDARQYRQAREALESALEIDPNNADAAQLLDTVQRQMRLERNTAANPPPTPAPNGGANANPGPGGDAPTGNAPQAAAPSRPPPRDYLSPEQINLLKQMEVTEEDRALRVRLSADLRRRFIEYKNLVPNDFNSMSPADQALAILRWGAPEMKKDVQILSDPQSVMEYRRNIQNRLLQGCATAGCHGTTSGGGFVLFAPADNDQTTYSNYLILQTYAKTIGGKQYKMVDRLQPEDSLLLQYGLPRQIASLDHPDVAGATWNGIFRGKNDPTYITVGRWMGRMLPPVVPDYGVIEYAPPTATSATQPAATQPAAR
ncbi:MAG TPA: hypothetical protein VK324_03625 [Tepidisphaeraceae bacterium]|nr:hypothetical protein [Tepidisphaeraceae bacterium]